MAIAQSTLVRRKPCSTWRKIVDIAGVKVGHIEVVRHVGFLGNQSAWECKCDCGKTGILRGPFINQALKGNQPYVRQMHCGCRRVHRGFFGKPGYGTWKRLRPILVARWAESFPLFASECWSNRTPGRIPAKIYDSLPLGPGNVRWIANNVPNGEATKRRVIEYLAVSRGLSLDEAAKAVNGLTRERIRQLSNKALGLCYKCGGQLGKFKSECDRCHDRKYLRTHPMAIRVPDMPGHKQYPWDQWLDGSTWELTVGEDFTCSVAGFRSHLSNKVEKRGKQVITRLRGNKLYIKAVELEVPA